MTSFAASALTQSATEGQTISTLHLRAERSNARKTISKHWSDGRWIEMPAWRFYRQVIRVGLYLRERLHLAPGDRVALMSPLRIERIVADWASIIQGGVVATLDTRLPPEALGPALMQLAPKVTFAAGPSELALLRELASQGANPGIVITFDGDAIVSDNTSESPAAHSVRDGKQAAQSGAHAWSEVLDLGGTLDTAERAQKFRALAREVGPGAPAVAYSEGTNGTTEWKFLSHADVARRVGEFRALPGDVAYVGAGHLGLQTLLALRAFVGDGHTTTVIGTPGREVEEVAEMWPHVLVAPPEVIDRSVRAYRLRHSGGSLARAWLQRVRSLGSLRPLRRWAWIQPDTGRAAGDERLRDVMTLDGTRVGLRNRTTGDAQ